MIARYQAAKPKRRKGAGKGQGFERMVCKALSRWVTNGEHEDCFWRTAMSGGRATFQRKKGVAIRQTGDITSTAPEGMALTAKWFIECKHVKQLSIPGFLLTGQGLLAEFWRVAVAQAKLSGKEPMLIAKQNFTPTMLIVPIEAPVADMSIGPICHSALNACDIYLFDQVVGHRT